MNITTQIGLLTELQCQIDFSSLGILLSQPITNDSRYDYISDINGTLYKIQCKTCEPTPSGDAIKFPCSNKNWNNGIRKTYKNDIDFFYTSYNQQGYLIPIDEAPSREMILRFSSRQPNNTNIKWAEDYKLEKMIIKIGGKISKIQKNTYSIKKSNSICIDCGDKISRKALRCKKCNNIYKLTLTSKKINIPEREELKEMIRNRSFLSLSKIYNVSDNAIRRWCDKYNIPRTKKKEIKSYSDEEWSVI